MKCPECGGLMPEATSLRQIPHRRGCSFWDLTSDFPPQTFVETLVTAWDLDVRAFFDSLQRNNRPPGNTAKTVFNEACRLADEAEKIRREKRGDDLPWEPTEPK